MRTINTTLLVLSALLAAGISTAQETTERYIPIGKSPGVSGKYSYLGEIVSVDTAAREVVVRDSRGDHRISLTDETHIWIDNNARKKTNALGSSSDCQIGTRVEIMHTRDNESVARWIKIDAGS